MGTNMLRLNCLRAACVLALAINVGAAEATGHGVGGRHGVGGWHGIGGRHGIHGFHGIRGWHGSGNRGRYYGGGYYGGYGVAYYDTPNYSNEPVDSVSLLQPLGPVIPATFALSCRHNQEIVTVPSENGGDRQIKITRC